MNSLPVHALARCFTSTTDHSRATALSPLPPFTRQAPSEQSPGAFFSVKTKGDPRRRRPAIHPPTSKGSLLRILNVIAAAVVVAGLSAGTVYLVMISRAHPQNMHARIAR